MKTKQEVIKEAWLEFMSESDYENLKIDENGFCNYQCRYYIINSKWDGLYSRMKSGGKTGRDIIYRPKSLSGLETNNGWIRIESESDLPRKENSLWLRYEDGSTILGRYNIFTNKFVTSHGKMFDDDNPTHYQYITQPLPPLY